MIVVVFCATATILEWRVEKIKEKKILTAEKKKWEIKLTEQKKKKQNWNEWTRRETE